MLTPAQAPLYEIKANLFKALAHPARIRILELLAAAPENTAAVSYLLAETGLEASHLSQHLATLRKHKVVTSVRSANAVTYRLAHPGVAELSPSRAPSCWTASPTPTNSSGWHSSCPQGTCGQDQPREPRPGAKPRAG